MTATPHHPKDSAVRTAGALGRPRGLSTPGGLLPMCVRWPRASHRCPIHRPHSLPHVLGRALCGSLVRRDQVPALTLPSAEIVAAMLFGQSPPPTQLALRAGPLLQQVFNTSWEPAVLLDPPCGGSARAGSPETPPRSHPPALQARCSGPCPWRKGLLAEAPVRAAVAGLCFFLFCRPSSLTPPPPVFLFR